MRLTPRTRIILLVVAIVGLIVAISVGSYKSSQVGSVTIAMDDSSKTAHISLTGSHSVLSKDTVGSSVIYKLRKGDYHLSITRDNYKPLTTDLTVRTGDKLQVTGHLELINDPTITSVEQISGLAGNGYILGDINYFYSKTWAVLGLSLPGTDPAFAVVSYDVDSASWKLVLGPGTDFSDDDLQALPPDVSDYLGNLVTGGNV